MCHDRNSSFTGKSCVCRPEVWRGIRNSCVGHASRFSPSTCHNGIIKESRLEREGGGGETLREFIHGPYRTARTAAVVVVALVIYSSPLVSSRMLHCIPTCIYIAIDMCTHTRARVRGAFPTVVVLSFIPSGHFHANSAFPRTFPCVCASLFFASTRATHARVLI